jgi:hypothetical protein
MHKTILDAFNDRQRELMKAKMWWVADRDKPYLIKFGVEGDYVMMRTYWLNKN